MTRLGAALVSAAAAVLALAAPAQGAVPRGNLLKNPSAEAGPAIDPQSPNLKVPIPSWTTGGTTFTVIRYGQGPVNAPRDPPKGGGTKYFAGGFNGSRIGAVATATQDVGVSAAGFEIGLGVVRATVSAVLGGCARDSGRVEAIFLDVSGAELGRLTVGPVSATQSKKPPQFSVELVPRSAAGAVPPGTRSIRVVMTSTQVENGGCQGNSWNNGYFDNLRLTLALDVTAAALQKLGPADAAKLLVQLPPAKAAALVARLPFAKGVAILRAMPKAKAKAVVAKLPPTLAKRYRKALGLR